MKYIICAAAVPEDLVEEVNKKIGEGFVPVGGVAIAMDNFQFERVPVEHQQVMQTLVQAMVQPDKANASESKIIKRVFNG